MKGETHVKILMIATEAVPFAKEGGVADVMGSLPKELAALGHEVCLFLPRYGSINPARWELTYPGVVRSFYHGGAMRTVSVSQTTLPGSNVKVYLLEHDEFFGWHQHIYFGLEREDEQLRFLLFCRGLLEMLPDLGFYPDMFHLNDWQTAPCAAYLRTTHRHLLRDGGARIVYTIHNLQYQGRWGPAILDQVGLNRGEVFRPWGLEFWGEVNWMKAGIVYADVVTTVSHRYAEEIQTPQYGWGLEGVLSQRHDRIFGIPNGIDWEDWNPAHDPNLVAHYSAEDADAAVEAKKRNRLALRQEFGLPENSPFPLISIVSRLVDQKGFDLIAAIADDLRNMPLQLVVLGTGHAGYEQLFRHLAGTSDNIRARIGFDVALSHRMYAGADFFLMPSAFEPGGLGQLIALRYGTLPVVHAIGGLADTVTDLYADSKAGNGISFIHYDANALRNALYRALKLYTEEERWPELVARAMAYDSRWSSSARAYSELYQRIFEFPPM
jgi:starch synthase